MLHAFRRIFEKLGQLRLSAPQSFFRVHALRLFVFKRVRFLLQIGNISEALVFVVQRRITLTRNYGGLFRAKVSKIIRRILHDQNFSSDTRNGEKVKSASRPNHSTTFRSRSAAPAFFLPQTTKRPFPQTQNIPGLSPLQNPSDPRNRIAHDLGKACRVRPSLQKKFRERFGGIQQDVLSLSQGARRIDGARLQPPRKLIPVLFSGDHSPAAITHLKCGGNGLAE